MVEITRRTALKVFSLASLGTVFAGSGLSSDVPTQEALEQVISGDVIPPFQFLNSRPVSLSDLQKAGIPNWSEAFAKPNVLDSFWDSRKGAYQAEFYNFETATPASPGLPPANSERKKDIKDDMQDNVIAAQHLSRAVYAVTRVTSPKAFETYLKTQMGMDEENPGISKEIAADIVRVRSELTARFDTFREPFEEAFDARHPTAAQQLLLTDLALNTYNRVGNQLEHFADGEKTFARLLNTDNPDTPAEIKEFAGNFRTLLQSRLTGDPQSRDAGPESLQRGMAVGPLAIEGMGIPIAGNMTRKADEFFSAVNQALDRLRSGTKAAAANVPIQTLAKAAAPFPDFLAKKSVQEGGVEPLAKETQTMAQIFLAIRNAHMVKDVDGKIILPEEDLRRARLLAHCIAHQSGPELVRECESIIANDQGNVATQRSIVETIKMKNAEAERFLKAVPALINGKNPSEVNLDEAEAGLGILFGKTVETLQLHGALKAEQAEAAVSYVAKIVANASPHARGVSSQAIEAGRAQAQAEYNQPAINSTFELG